jgi:hypothetical protein
MPDVLRLKDRIRTNSAKIRIAPVFVFSAGALKKNDLVPLFDDRLELD